MLPLPAPPPGLPYTSYCDKGGRFGPHNLHLPQGHPHLEDREDRLYMTWFNAGLRVYDIADARTPQDRPIGAGKYEPSASARYPRRLWLRSRKTFSWIAAAISTSPTRTKAFTSSAQRGRRAVPRLQGPIEML